MVSKRGQVTIFIIIAIILVAGVAGFFIFRNTLDSSGMPQDFEPIYNSFLTCVEDNALIGANVLGSKGGYIYLPDFVDGSPYMPFSSQLDFMGSKIPYWYYVSGNNFEDEQVPSLGEMEDQLSEFMENEIRDCAFDSYYEQGFIIVLGEPKVSTRIRNGRIDLDIDMDFSITRADEEVFVRSHSLSVDSHLGEMYDSAREIYEYEQDSLFLEDYGVDVLRLYAPVDGVELSCSPMTWNANDVFVELQNGLEANVQALKVRGGNYDLNDDNDKYFVIDKSINSEHDVRFLYSKVWPNSFQVHPSEGIMMISEPVGNQQGLGLLGFCYVPYHYVYDIKYPVLVQIMRGEELFQFPLAVIIQGNVPREALDSEASVVEGELCRYQNSRIDVYVYDTNLDVVDSADVSYECVGEECVIGRTENGRLEGEFPQCVNGFVRAEAEGYESTQKKYSTIDSGAVEIYMNPLYDIDVELRFQGEIYDSGSAIVSFVKENVSSKTIAYPEQESVELAEGQYIIETQIFKNSSLRIEGFEQEKCVEVPQSGLGGLLGLTEEKCYDFEVPDQVISNAIVGGGFQNYYVLQEELENSNKVIIDVPSLPIPRDLEQLQENYFLLEEKRLDVYFE